MAGKEFLQLQTAEAACDDPGKKFVLTSPQLYLVRYVAPTLPENKITVAVMGTGTGKTAAGLMAAMPYIEMFRREFAQRRRALQQQERARGQRVSRAGLQDVAATTPSVFVLGFSEVVFRSELASREAFGVATEEELAEIRRLRGLAAGPTAEAAQRQLRNLLAGMKRRMVDKLRGGFWKFVGYQELTNRLFSRCKVQLPDLIRIADSQGTPFSEVVRAAEKKGALKVNWAYLDRFRDSFLICDEIHHTYNSKMPNNWGGCLRLVLELGGVARTVLLTATPARGLATELVDLANLVRSAEGRAPVASESFFSVVGQGARRHSVVDKRALARLAAEFRGRLLFYQSVGESPLVFPRWEYRGELLRGLSEAASAGVRFRVGACAREQIERYQAVLDAGFSPASAEAGAIRDAAFPCPPSGERPAVALNSKDFERIAHAPAAWRKRHQIGYDVKRGAVTGGAVANPKVLQRYSAALAEMRRELLAHVKERRGKLMIFHPRVRGMGVETIANVVEGVGVRVVREVSKTIAPATGRGICADASAHKCTDACPRMQAVVLHSYLEQGAMDRVLNTWNSDENAFGGTLMILIASEVLEEMHTLLATPHQYILGVPQNIASLRQLNGRVVRLHVMRQLPPEKRRVEFRVFAGSMQGLRGRALEYGAEGWNVEAWRVLLREYQTIRACERALFAEAPGVGQLRSARGLSANRLGPLPFTPRTPKANPAAFSTYDARGYSEETSARYADAIVAVLLREGALSYDDLRKALAEGRGGMCTEFAPISGGALSVPEFDRALAALAYSPARTTMDLGGRTVAIRGRLVFLAQTEHDRPVVDHDLADSIVRGMLEDAPKAPAPLDVGVYVREVKSFYNFQVQRDSWLSRLPEERAEIAAQFDLHTEDFHHRMLRELLASKPAAGARTRLLDAYRAYGFVLGSGLLAPHRGRAGFYRRGGAEILVGSAWTQIGTSAPSLKEAPMVGMYEVQGDRIQFKLRKATPATRREGDRRTLERGVACMSKRKEELRRLVAEHTGAAPSGSSGDLCEQLKLALLRKQLSEPRAHFLMFYYDSTS